MENENMDNIDIIDENIEEKKNFIESDDSDFLDYEDKNLKEKNKKNYENSENLLMDGENNDFINEEDELDNYGSAFSFSAKLVNPEIYKNIIIPGIKEEFILYPLEPGFGATIGHSLRRIMLSHITGFAISAIKIFGCIHRFQSIPGIRENVCDILMNLKEVYIKVNSNISVTSFFATIKFTGPGELLAKDIIIENATICNPEKFICYVDINKTFEATLLICFGRGYVIAENNKIINTTAKDDAFLEEAIFLDSTYNNIKHVQYIVEPTRVEERTNYDKLIMTIETTGAVTPQECLGRAYQLLYHQMTPLKDFNRINLHIEEQEKDKPKINIPEIMYLPIDKTGLPNRVINGLKYNNIIYIGDLVITTEAELTRYPHIGKESIKVIKDNLANLQGEISLTLGIQVEGWEQYRKTLS